MLTATVCVALSGAGLAMSLLTAWRRRFRRAIKLAAVSLLPVGLYLAGLITLGSKIGTAVGGWAADLVLKPTVWAGFAVIAVAVVLYVASRIGAHRGAPAPDDRQAVRGRAADPLAPRSSAPAISAPASGGAKRGKGDAELDDIEAILRKHGI